MASHRSRAAALLTQLDTLTDAAVLEQGARLVAYARSLSRVLREASRGSRPLGNRGRVRHPAVGRGPRAVAPSPAVGGQEGPRRRRGRPKKKEEASPARRRRGAG
jgi:hypothetical protein